MRQTGYELAECPGTKPSASYQPPISAPGAGIPACLSIYGQNAISVELKIRGLNAAILIVRRTGFNFTSE
jgi:hypothetical protein